LGISPGTVASHITSIHLKLGISRRRQIGLVLERKQVDDLKSSVQAFTTAQLTGKEKNRSMKVLVIDDEPDILEVVSLCFEVRWPEASVLTAPTGELGIEEVKSKLPDVTILDIGLPDIDGFEVCRQIREFSNVPIIMLTVHKAEEDIIKALEMGADDYITKPFRPVEFLARVKAVLRRSQLSPISDGEAVFQFGNLLVDFAHGEVYVNNQPIQLTPTEYKLFHHLVKSAGKIVASKALLDDIWGDEYRGEPYFLAVRLAQLKQKLEGHPHARRLMVNEEPEGFALIPTS